MIIARYRRDYDGEFVITESRWVNGQKKQTREWIPNLITNQHISGRAACIGSAIDKQYFDYTRLQKHRGGLLGSKTLQTYGVGEIAQSMRLNFAIDRSMSKLQLLIDSKYTDNNVVYTTAKNCISCPGIFYLIPYNINLDPVALTVYLAAFDGHNEIFLLGYNQNTPAGNSAWQEHVTSVMKSYKGVKFYVVGEEHLIPSQWMDCSNFKSISYREFISYCDV